MQILFVSFSSLYICILRYEWFLKKQFEVLYYLLMNLIYLLKSDFKLGAWQMLWVCFSIIAKQQHDCIPQRVSAIPEVIVKYLF